MNTSFGKQPKMKYYKIFLFLVLMIVDVSTNAQEVTCEGEQLINVDILFGHPSIDSPYKPGHVLGFRCTDVKLKLYGHRAIECLPNGKWDYPYPKCDEVTCEGEQLINVDILTGHPSISSPFKPGHILVFRCTDVKLKMYGQRTIECLPNGKWDYPYPKCEEIRCEAPRDQHVYRPYDFRGDMTLGTKQYYSCESGYEKMATEATCTEDGWKPKPLCVVMTGTGKCGPPPNVNNADTKDMTKSEYNTGDRVEYVCFNKYTLDPPSSKYMTCRQGQWSGNINCLMMTGTGKCGPPPNVNNADTKDMTKSEYNTGDRVEYVCFNKYTLDPPSSKYMTCRQGQWSGKINCLKPCTVTKEIMDGRGIELAYAEYPKMFAPHNDHITFRCQGDKRSRGIPFRQKCNDGHVALPQCV